METKKTAPQEGASEKMDGKETPLDQEIDFIQRDFEYMVALYRDKKYVAGEPRYCDFTYAEIADFLSTLPQDGTLRIYYGLHFQNKDLSTTGKPMVRSSTTDPSYVNCHTLILCKVDKNGNEMLEITREKRKPFLVPGGKSPMDGGSLCPPKATAVKPLLMTNADKEYPNP